MFYSKVGVSAHRSGNYRKETVDSLLRAGGFMGHLGTR